MRYTIAVLLLFACASPLAAADVQPVGLTQGGRRIDVSVVRAASAGAPTVLVVGGLAEDVSPAVAQAAAAFDALPPERRRFHLLAIPGANPDAAGLAFPPAGTAYRENAGAHALWRWIGIHAPDLVLVAGPDESGLAAALSSNVVAGIGRIPARHVEANASLLDQVPATIAPSEARRELERRRARSPGQLAGELAQVYGRDFDQFTYIPGMALIGRLRLGHQDDVARLAAPWMDGSRDPLARPSSLAVAGHLVFAELAERTGSDVYLLALRRAADSGFTADGAMRASMPYHNEMSDSLFMETAILVRTGRLTGERKYFDMAARHVAFMQALVFRPDGLYRHSPLTDSAWGRGNGFPALGLAMTLEGFPADHPAFEPMRQSFVRHMTALAAHQDADGLWRQVIDHPGSYPELSATAMIGTAMAMGIRHGWLDAKTYRPRVDAAWRAVVSRVGRDGVLLDVCESTNKQPSLEAYLQRAAILGPDPRGGGMALIFATELAGLR
jgi:rhamnogalacturonyl hydrolase YesR